MSEHIEAFKGQLPEQGTVGLGNLLRVPVGQAVFLLAWPAIFANLLENIATTVDLIMVGRLGAAEVASVGTCGMMYWVLCSYAIGLSVSAMAIVARNIGGGKQEYAGFALGESISIAIVASFIVALITIGLAPLIFTLYGVAPDVWHLSVDYLRILSIGMPFFAIMSVASGALRGAGDTRTPMFVGLAANAFHIALNYVLIFGKLGMPVLGTNGAAIGTTLSYGLASVIYLMLFFRRRLVINLRWKDFRWDFELARQVIRLGLPAALEQFVVQLGLMIYVRFIVGFGTIGLSAYQVGMRVLSLSFIPNFGFSTAASALIGQNLGAGRKQEAKQAGWICLWWAMFSMSAVGLTYLLFSHWLAAQFIDDPEVIELGSLFIRIVGVCQVGMAVYFTLAGALRGAGDTRWPLLITLLSMYGFRIPATWVVIRFFGMGLFGTWNLLFGDYIIRVVFVLLRYSRGKWLETRV